MRYQTEWKPCTNLQDQTWNTKEILCFMEGYFEEGPQTYRGWGWVLSSANVGKKSTCNVGGPGLIPGSGRSSGEGIGYSLQYCWASLVAQLVKNLPAMGETWVQSLVWEDPLQKGKATYSSTPVFWPREFHGLYSHIESETTERLSLSMMIEDTLLVDPGFFFN